MFKVGDIVRLVEAEDWGYIAKEDEKNFWIQWFISDDDNPAPIYKYSKVWDKNRFKVER
jgi:hypothetical protein